MTDITICDKCGERINDMDIPHPMIEVKVSNGVDHDIEGDYCVHCARDVAEGIRQVVEGDE